MGYRSNIEVLCGSKAYEELHAVMKKHQWSPDYISKVKNHDVYFIELCSYKWYNSYNDVQEFMAVLDDCNSHSGDPDYFYSFIRLGEEQEDVETHCNHEFNEPYNDHYVYTATERPLLEPIDELI
jgi:hypothetical protein